MSFKLFCRYFWNPTGWKMLTICWPQAQRPQTAWNQKVVDVGSCYQKNAWAHHAHHSPLLHLVFKTFPWKPSGHSGFLSTRCPDSLLDTSKNAALSFTTARCQCIGFATGGWADPTLFGNTTPTSGYQLHQDKAGVLFHCVLPFWTWCLKDG